MSFSTARRRLAILFVFLLSALGANAAAPRAITRIPYEIKTPGRYVLSRSLNFTNQTAVAAILISCDDVVLDLADWTLTCDATLGATKEVAGVRANSRKNITIRNGTVRGFARGIYLEGVEDTGSNLIENIHADHCTFLGIQVKGRGSIVRKNRVTSVGGHTVFLANRFGIHLTGTGTKALDNEIFDIEQVGNTMASYGIYAIAAGAITVSGNRVTKSAALPILIVPTVGIFFDTGCTGSLAENNVVTGWFTGIQFGNSSDGIYRGNTALNCGAKYQSGVNGIDGGDNK